MKKLLSLALCAVMLMALALVAFADEPHDSIPDYINGTGGSKPGAEPMDFCVHTYITVKASDRYISEGPSGCSRRIAYVTSCTKCGAFLDDASYTEKFPVTPHNNRVYQATCNGVTQIWYNRCSNCNYTSTENKPCPAAPHKNGCNFLPVAVKPPLVTE